MIKRCARFNWSFCMSRSIHTGRFREVNNRINRKRFLQNDAHGFNDHFARAEMFIRVDFEGWIIKIPFAKYWYQYISPRKSRVYVKRSFSSTVIKAIEVIYCLLYTLGYHIMYFPCAYIAKVGEATKRATIDSVGENPGS